MDLPWGPLLFVWITVAGFMVGVVFIILRLTSAHIETALKAAKAESELREAQAKTAEKYAAHYEKVQATIMEAQGDTGRLLTENYAHVLSEMGALLRVQGQQGVKAAESASQIQGQLAIKIAMLFKASSLEPGQEEVTQRMLREICESPVNLGMSSHHGEPEPEMDEAIAPQHMA